MMDKESCNLNKLFHSPSENIDAGQLIRQLDCESTNVYPASSSAFLSTEFLSMNGAGHVTLTLISAGTWHCTGYSASPL